LGLNLTPSQPKTYPDVCGYVDERQQHVGPIHTVDVGNIIYVVFIFHAPVMFFVIGYLLSTCYKLPIADNISINCSFCTGS